MIIDCAAYADGARQTGRLGLGEVAPWLARDDAFVWLGLRMPSHDELATVCDAFDLRGIDVREVLAPHQRPVLTVGDGVSWLVLRTAEYIDAREVVSLGEISVLVNDRFVISIRHGQGAPLSETRRALEADPEVLGNGAVAALLAIVEAVVASYGPALDGFEKDAVQVEREVLSESRHRPVRRLLNLSRQVRELQLVIEAIEDPLARLGRNRRLRWSEATRDELESILSQVQRVAARSRTLSDLVNAAHGANLAQVSQQQNDDMRKISAWVAIAAVPTMVAGIYGMNFEDMPELAWAPGYPLVLVSMAIACALLYRSFRRQGWL